MKNGNNDDQKKLTFKKVTLRTGITGGMDDISIDCGGGPPGGSGGGGSGPGGLRTYSYYCTDKTLCCDGGRP